MKENMSNKEQKITMAVGSAAAATAIFAPLGYKWKAILSAIAAGGLLTGVMRVSPVRRMFGLG